MRSLAAAVALLALAGCGGGPRTQLRVIVPDAELRRQGEPCAGAEPFGYVHAAAAYRVLDARGTTVARGKLPEGKAVPAFNGASGRVASAPSFCQMILGLDVGAGGYRLVLGQGPPLKFTPRAGRATVVLQ